MQQTKSIKTKSRQFQSVKEFVKEKGWYVPSLHEKYLSLVEKDEKVIKQSMEKHETLN